LTSEVSTSTDTALTLAKISLTSIEGPKPDALQALVEFLSHAGSLFIATVRDGVKFVRLSFHDFDDETPDPGRELHLLSLYRSAKYDDKPRGNLAYFSLTERDQRSRLSWNTERSELSLVWPTRLGDT